ncbi:MAG: response regulator SirA [Rhodospirillaceae bacterium]|nr:response regulator SirA [Rhodospirillaceae bacterium]|tara:strand:- start:142 stop:381 length:240 start_codon:yes stop_codon:yes gene_type:complete
MYGKNKYFIDVTQEICPITFVKVKIKLESMPSGKTLEVKCRGKEAFENISKSALINGYKVDSKEQSENFENNLIRIKKY